MTLTYICDNSRNCQILLAFFFQISQKLRINPDPISLRAIGRCTLRVGMDHWNYILKFSIAGGVLTTKEKSGL